MLKVAFVLCLVACAYGAIDNGSPKREPNIWDTLMVRGANGQLQSLSDRMHQQNRQDTPVCEDCQKIVRFIDNALKTGEKFEEFKSTLKLLCDILPHDEQQSCKNIIDNLDVVLRRLEPLLSNPHQFCEEIALCATDNVPHVVQVAVHWMAARIDGPLEANDIVCDECTFVFTELRSIVQEKGSKEYVESALESLCKYLPGDMQKECDSIIKEYFNFLWAEIEALLNDPKGVCTEFGFCKTRRLDTQAPRTSMLRLVPAMIRRVHSEATPRLDSASRFLRFIQTRDGSNAGCMVCKMALTGFIDFLKLDKGAQKSLCKMVQDTVCNKILPHAYSADCNDFVGLYLQAVLQMTLDEIKPDTFCTDIKVCKKTDLKAFYAKSPEEKNAILCEACTIVSEFLQHEINDRSVQDEITGMVKRACMDLPKDIQQECSAIVDTYAPAILQTLAIELNPEKICPALHMCPPSAQ